MATLGFIIDYVGRMATFILLLIAPAELFADWRWGLTTTGLAAAVWVGTRIGRRLLAGYAIDPMLQMPLSWW